MNTKLERKVSEVVTRHTLVKETENHIFKISDYTENLTNGHMRGVIDHKDGTHCGDFMIRFGRRNALSVNLNLDCKELLSDLLVMIDDMKSGNIVEVDEFNYVKEAAATSTDVE